MFQFFPHIERAILTKKEIHRFQHKRAHPVILDGKEIGTTIGYKHNGDYFHYINGHTLDVSASKCVYKSLTYIDVIEPQETVWIQDMSVVGIAIHNFIDTSERVAPDNPRFHGQLEHVRDMLEQAVLRRILDTPPDGEATLDRKHIDRGYAQFCAAMYLRTDRTKKFAHTIDCYHRHLRAQRVAAIGDSASVASATSYSSTGAELDRGQSSIYVRSSRHSS